MPVQNVDRDSQHARRNRRLTLRLALLAAAFYAGFVVLAIVRARG